MGKDVHLPGRNDKTGLHRTVEDHARGARESLQKGECWRPTFQACCCYYVPHNAKKDFADFEGLPNGLTTLAGGRETAEIEHDMRLVSDGGGGGAIVIASRG